MLNISQNNKEMTSTLPIPGIAANRALMTTYRNQKGTQLVFFGSSIDPFGVPVYFPISDHA